MSTSRDRYLRRTYHITEAEYLTLLEMFGGGCWACGRKPKPGKNLHVDHNHKTKNVRALLCWHCNQILRPSVTPEQLEGLAEVLEYGEQDVKNIIGHNGKGK